ncbi:MAG: cation-translocating P-type ATPase [Actinomycetota bacterium]|nr:cation-translocating P-type ATPase [Actinomycetota bacterium]
MTTATTSASDEAAGALWDEEPSNLEGHARIRARISGLHCSLCTGTIEKALGRIDGVDKVAVSLTHEQALVDYDPDLVRPEVLLGTLRDIGYDLYDPRKVRPFEEEEAALVREGKRLLVATGLSLLAIALIVLVDNIFSVLVPATVVVSLVPVAFFILRPFGAAKAAWGTVALTGPPIAVLVARANGVGTPLIPWIVGALAVGVVFGVAGHILRMAYQSARRGILNQHVLLETGAFAGIAGGVYGLTVGRDDFPTAPFFAVTVLVANYHIFSEWLSLLVKTRSSQAVRRLLDLQPDTARVRRGDDEVEVPIAEVALGDLVRVRPGERIPVDGEVVSGHSAVDQALVTGEPVPVERSEGDPVIGGSINTSGTLLVRVTAVGSESFLAQIVRHVEDARALKPGILHLVDRVLRVYTPTVLLVAAVAALGWTLGTAVFGAEADVERAVFAGLGVLVMGYPCAVGIAAPLAIVRGAGEAADEGIIMRTGEAFQAFRSVTHVVLDKTGTLTEGRPTVREVEALADPDELVRLAAAAESASEHPLGQAVVAWAFERKVALPSVSDFESVTGFGVSAVVEGRRILVGRPRFLEEAGVDLGALRSHIERLQDGGRTVIAVSREGQALGILALGDELRADAGEAVAAMRRAKLTPVLVTGDNETTARRVAAQLGIDDVHGGVLPEDKAEIIRRLQAGGNTVAMVGDGINDAPALMQANVGVAMGGGTDIAMESADIIIVGNEVSSVLRAREISRRSYRTTRQNVSLAFLFNGIGIPAATTGLIYPVWAMVAMAASVTTIFVNSIGGRPSLLFDAISSVGRTEGPELKDAKAVDVAT